MNNTDFIHEPSFPNIADYVESSIQIECFPLFLGLLEVLEFNQSLREIYARNVERILNLVGRKSHQPQFKTWLAEFNLKYEALNAIRLLDQLHDRSFTQKQMIKYLEYCGVSEIILNEGTIHSFGDIAGRLEYFIKNKKEPDYIEKANEWFTAYSWGLDFIIRFLIAKCVYYQWIELMLYFFDLIQPRSIIGRYDYKYSGLGLEPLRAYVNGAMNTTSYENQPLSTKLLKIELEHSEHSLYDDPWDEEMRKVCSEFKEMIIAVASTADLEKNIERQIICRSN